MSPRTSHMVRRAVSSVRHERLENRYLLCGIPHEQWVPAPEWDAQLERSAQADHEAGGDAAANLVWANRGLASDRFDEVFGTSAGAARAVVDAVLVAWERVITDFNRADGTSTLQINISMHASNTGFGAAGGPSSSAPADGKPRTGSVTINRGNNSANANDDNGFYLDPDPFDNDAFQGTILNAFAGVDSASVGSDFFSLVSAEVCHVLGLISDPNNDGGGFNGYRFENFVTNTGIRDNAEGGGSFGHFYTFDGPTIDHLMTSYNSGDANSASWGNAVHSAGSGGNINFAGQNWRGSEDSGNASYGNERTLPSFVMANVLKDAYGYSIANPATFGSFYVIHDTSTGNVNVRGGDFHVGSPISNDDIYVSVDGSELVITVDPPVDVPGTHLASGAGNFPGWSTRLPIAGVNLVTINAEDGDDRIYIYGVPNGVTVSVIGGNGNDLIQIGNGDIDNPDGIQGNVTINAGAGSDSLTYFDLLDDVGNDTYTITETTITKTGSAIVTYGGSTLESLVVAGSGLNNTFRVNSTFSTVDYSLSGFAGDDQFIFASDFDAIDANVTVSGGNGTDSVLIDDSADTGDDTYLITGNRIERGPNGAVFVSNSTESVDITCNNGNNTINVPQLSSWMNVTIRGSDGNDAFNVGSNNFDINLLGTVSVVGGVGSDSLTASDSADTGDDDYNITFNRIDKGGTSFIGYTGLELVSLAANGGNNDITLLSTTTPTPILINGNNGNDHFIVNDGTSFLFNFGGDVTLNGGAGTDTLSISDENYAGTGNYTITNGQVVAPFNSFDVFHSGNESLFVTGSEGVNTINVNQTNIATFIIGDGGNDVINVGGGDFDTNITATVLTVGGEGDDLVVVQDTADAGNNVWTINNSSVTKDSSATAILSINFFGPQIERVRIDAGSGNSTFNVASIGSSSVGASVTVNGGNGSDTMNVLPNSGSLATSFYGNVAFDGQGGSDSFAVSDVGDTGNDTYNIDSNSIGKSDWSTNQAIYLGTESIVLNASNVASTINMSSSPVGASWRINANGGDDAINIVGHAVGTVIDVSTGTATSADSVSVNSDAAGVAHVRLVDVTDTLSSLNIYAEGKVTVPQNGNAVVKVSSVILGGGLDLNDNALIRSATGGAPNGTFYYTRLATGHNGGAWNGATQPYIHSSVAASTAVRDGIGYGFGAALAINTINGLSIAPGDFVLRYTLDGDTNLDRAVNFDDLLKLAQNYSNTVGGRVWTDGNFDFDAVEGVAGSVGFSDLLALAQNYNTSAVQEVIAAVTKPSAATSAATKRKPSPFSEIMI